MWTVPPPRDQHLTEAVCPILGVLEAVPGLWTTGAREGMVLLTNLGVSDESLERGATVAAVANVSAQTRTCDVCGAVDTDAWLGALDACADCGRGLSGGMSACRGCGSDTTVFALGGCASCQTKPVDAWQDTGKTWVREHDSASDVVLARWGCRWAVAVRDHRESGDRDPLHQRRLSKGVRLVE